MPAPALADPPPLPASNLIGQAGNGCHTATRDSRSSQAPSVHIPEAASQTNEAALVLARRSLGTHAAHLTARRTESSISSVDSRQDAAVAGDYRAEYVQLYQDHQGGDCRPPPQLGPTLALVHIQPTLLQTTTRAPPSRNPAARHPRDVDPLGGSTPASCSSHGDRQLSDPPSGMGSARQFEQNRRQDAADKRAGVAENRYQQLAKDVRQAHVAATGTATLVQHMMDRLDANHQENIRRTSDLAAAATASRDRDLERWTILETKLTATREADNGTLDARTTPLVTGLIAKTTAALAMNEAAERAVILDALVEIREQSDTRERSATAAFEGIRRAVHELQETLPAHQDPPTPCPQLILLMGSPNARARSTSGGQLGTYPLAGNPVPPRVVSSECEATPPVSGHPPGSGIRNGPGELCDPHALIPVAETDAMRHLTTHRDPRGPSNSTLLRHKGGRRVSGIHGQG